MSSNPFIGNNPQHTVSQREMALSVFHLVLVDREEPARNDLCLDFDDCCALMYVVQGVQEALRDALNKLDGYRPKE